MIQENSLLVRLVTLVDQVPSPAAAKLERGRPKTYSDRLFLKAIVIMIIKHLHRVYELLSVLEQPTVEMQLLHELLSENGRYPTRRTWERRLKGIPESLPAQIGCFGRYLVTLILPWAICARAVSIDSTILRSKGGVWHKKDRQAGKVPHTSIGQSQAGMAGSMAGNYT